MTISERIKAIPLFLVLLGGAVTAAGAAHSPRAQANWDSIKTQARPVVATALLSEYGVPYRQPLADYGWEDGLHISRDGRHLYALYVPGDILSSNMILVKNPNLTLCEFVGNMNYLRAYAKTYGMDLKTNSFGCDSFMNIDIVYAHRNTVSDTFKTWQLSGIARPGLIEGGPTPLVSRTNPDSTDIFLFTGNGDMWMIRNTIANPSGMGTAVRLPSPLNPDSNEFTADNPFIERLGNSDSLVLVYEKYTDPGTRDFMYSLSFNNGVLWSAPVLVSTVSNSNGHIEHPHLYRDSNGQWWFYYSINYEIFRSRQTISGNWDSWSAPELVIAKGNTLSLGEPSLTTDGGICFLAAYQNPVNNDSTDAFDCDPWFLPRTASPGISRSGNSAEGALQLSASPNPFTSRVAIQYAGRPARNSRIRIFSIAGKEVLAKAVTGSGQILWESSGFSSGIYIVRYTSDDHGLSRLLFLSK